MTVIRCETRVPSPPGLGTIQCPFEVHSDDVEEAVAAFRRHKQERHK